MEYDPEDTDNIGDEVRDEAARLRRRAGKAQKDLSDEAKRLAEEGKRELRKAGREGRRVGREAMDETRSVANFVCENMDNPVVFLNGLIGVIAVGFLGVKGYDRYSAGTLTWQEAGTWAAGLAAFALGDFFVSR